MIQFCPPVALADRPEFYRTIHCVTAGAADPDRPRSLPPTAARHHAGAEPDRRATLFAGSQISLQPVPVDTRQTGVRLLSEDIATLDQLAFEAAARSRSAYIVASLETFFADLEAAANAPSDSAV